MPPIEKHDFHALLARARDLIAKGGVHNWDDLADALKVNRNTMRSGLRRHFGIKSLEDIAKDAWTRKPLTGEENEDSFEFEADGNYGHVRSVQVLGQIKTVEQLLQQAGVKDKDWEVVNPKVKKWDVAIKLKKAKDEEEIRVVPSIYIEAPLRARNPKPFEPVIQPLHISLSLARTSSPPKKSREDKVKRALIVNDPQVGFRRTLHTTDLQPFHDRRVLDLALQVAQAEQIDHISFGGDCNDLSEWSNKYQAEPEFYWTTQPALMEWAWWLAQFRMARPDAELKMLEGNHDARMANLLIANMRQAYRLKPVDELSLPPALSMPRLLALHTLGVEYIGKYPDNGYWLNEHVFITHGDVVRAGPGDTAKAIVNKQAFTTVFGHIHRRESVTRRMKNHEGDLIYSAFCPGCACHIDGRVPGSHSRDQWQQGFAVIEYTQDSEHLIPIAVQDGQMLYNGKIWKARERDEEIGKMISKGLEAATPD